MSRLEAWTYNTVAKKLYVPESEWYKTCKSAIIAKHVNVWHVACTNIYL
jgi:hypothetical protein